MVNTMRGVTADQFRVIAAAARNPDLLPFDLTTARASWTI
jgi:hypothetical protein